MECWTQAKRLLQQTGLLAALHHLLCNYHIMQAVEYELTSALLSLSACKGSVIKSVLHCKNACVSSQPTGTVIDHCHISAYQFTLA